MTNKSLVSIVNEAISIERLLIESGGEITPELSDALAVNAGTLADKVDGYVHILERFEDLETHYKSRAEFFKKIAEHCKKAQDRLKENIKFAMQELEVTDLHGNDMRFKLSPTPGVMVIEDEDMVPVEYKNEVISTVIDKKALKDALKNGEVPGAKLVPGYSIRSYANTPDKKKKEVANV